MKQREEQYRRDHSQLAALLTAARVLIVLLIVSGILLWLSSCSRVDREYQAGYDMDSGRYSAGVKLSPGTGRRSLSANVTGKIDWSLGNRGMAKFDTDK